jgi:tyrosyl-tRNA synthetase
METKTSKDKNNILWRRTEEVIVDKHFRKVLQNGRKLRIKFGIDPTSSVLHLGHSVCLLALRELQKRGHKIILLIGDFTASIGDPSGRVKSRPILSTDQIKQNMKTYQEQAGKIIDLTKVEVRHNGEWWEKMSARGMLELAGAATYRQLVTRASFQARLKSNSDFTVREFIYPLLQGYDSVALKADVEIGGTDQRFNMLMGRQVQRQYGQELQDVILCPLIEGTKGTKKMSKSEDNYIALSAQPREMYGKIMSISDSLILPYFNLLTQLDDEEIKEQLKKGPRQSKASLAREIVEFYYDSQEAQLAQDEFNRVFQNQKQPIKIPEVKTKEGKEDILTLLVRIGLTTSRSKARQLIEQGGIRINDKTQNDWQKEVLVKSGMIVQRGKRKFIKLI